jgi:iron complex transport system permease protein
VSGTSAKAARLPAARAWRAGEAIAAAALLVAAAAVVSLATGPVAIAPARVLAILVDAATGAGQATRDAVIVLDVRLPRTVLAIIVGAGTAVSGAIMQGLFRNPLADPSLVGVSSGAALAAALWFVFSGALAGLLPGALAAFGLPLFAFLGGLAVTLVLHLLATRDGRTSTVTFLLAGVAIGALTSALIGLLVFVASEQQLREFTFWTLGSLGGATWPKIAVVAPLVGVVILLAPAFARGLDALALGEAEAFYLGIDVERLKRIAIVGVAAAVGACVAVSGVIGFVGLTVPHLVRMMLGPGHRLLLPVSALLGAALLIVADVIARTAAAPAEIPLGVMTAAAGAPFMLWLLVSRRRAVFG